MAAKRKTAQEAVRVPTAAERRATLDGIISKAQEEHGAGCVARAENTFASYSLRRPTGLISLDLALAGGWPAAAPSVLVGPDGVGKDYLLWRTAAEVQRIYGADFAMACYFTEFRPDKLYMKDYCGLQIAFSEDELADLDRARHNAGVDPLSAQDLDHYRRQTGTFISIYGVSADKGFDEVFNFTDTNHCQIVAVNSIGSLQTEAKEKTESFEDFAQQRNEAMLLSKAMPKFSMYLNRRDQYDRPNETTILLVNQVRSRDQSAPTFRGRPPSERDKYQTASNSRALKHHKAIELMLHNGAKIKAKDDESVVLGRKKQWELTKGKLGTHEGIRGEFDYYFGEGADTNGDLITTALHLGVMDRSGTSHYSYSEDKNFAFTANGIARAAEHLRKSPELVEHLRMACFRAVGTPCRHK